MTDYRPPVDDILFSLKVAGYDRLAELEQYAHADLETVGSLIEEAGAFMAEVVAPTNREGDVVGSTYQGDGVVVTPPSFKPAYDKLMASGWLSPSFPSQYGGGDFPQTVGSAIQELVQSSNMAFSLGPLLTHGFADAFLAYASDELKDLYLPRMISGEWMGTMNLTEPQAGTDVGALTTKAVPNDDGSWSITGGKIFITWGEHDLTPNIIHMVLARIDGAPAGTRGISLFVVPKFLVNDDGSLGARNEVRCVSIEHKMGIHASPTCTLAFGDDKGAVAYLVGEPNRGLEYMFIMMNAARLAVGLEGYSVAERAYQRAVDWARARVQGKPPVAAAEGPATIIHHPDVKRMLLTMKSSIEAMRALAMYAAFQLDIAQHDGDDAARAKAQARADLLIPIVKGWCTEHGNDVTHLGIQIHGGMGFIEETGAAQYARDVRITTIYEGTTGIQANDLIGRKIGRDGGAVLGALLADVTSELNGLQVSNALAQATKTAALEGVAVLSDAAQSLGKALQTAPAQAQAVAVPFLKLCGFVLGGWLMARSASIAATKLSGGDKAFYDAKLHSARFYAEQVLPAALGLARVVKSGAASVTETDAALI